MTVTIINNDKIAVVIERRTPLIIRPLYGAGATGAPGPPGLSGGDFIHVQSSPSMVWTINHNLGFNPSVSLFTTGGVQMNGEVVHTSLNQVVINLVIALAGSARLT